MPRVEEVQFVHWGSLRPDPVPLLVDGINVATGPNGSGKTCLLDGIKLLLGVPDFTAGRSPAKYMFDGAGAGTPADRAYLRATFANPIGPDRHHRVFAWAGHGCEHAERVTVACVVSGQERWYTVLPGRVRWGVSGRKLLEDLTELDGLPHSRRLGPRQYDDLLDRAGVTKALRGVLALPQGATDRLVEERPAGLLRRLLELTGKQTTLDEFREQRERYQQVRAQHDDTLRRYHAEQKHLELLEVKARDHLEWVSKRDELARLDTVLLPAARYRDIRDDHIEAVTERDQRRKAVEEDESAMAELDRELPVLTGREQVLDDQVRDAEAERHEVDVQLTELDQRIGELRSQARQATDERDRAHALAGGRTFTEAEQASADAENTVRDAAKRRDSLIDGLRLLQDEVATLRAGRPVPPAGLEAFRHRLANEGIAAVVVAEAADLPAGADDKARVWAEAALGQGLWAVVVPPDSYARATALAVEEGHRWPVAVAGEGAPREALAGLEAPAGFGRLLEHLDTAALDGAPQSDGREGVSPQGVRYGRVLSHLAVPEKPVLGRRARERRLAQAESEARRQADEIARLDAELPGLRQAWEHAREVATAARRLPELEAAAERITSELQEALTRRDPLSERRAHVQARAAALVGERGGLRERLRSIEQQRGAIASRLAETRRPQLERYARRAQELTQQLGQLRLSPEQQTALDAGDLRSTASLEHDGARLRREVDDASRYAEDVRDELILAQRDDQRRIVEEVDTLVAGRQASLDRQQQLVDEARRRYDDHVRAVVRLLNEEFARICTAAGADGEIRLVPGERPDELGVDVRVAHRAGEPRRSYRDASHSGGQRAKIAILILLAAMGLGGAADLLVMDEHIAHLDSTNIDHIAELMAALKQRVQFVLATPTNAESLRLGWCDLQLAFLPRRSGEPYTPPIRVLTRLGADDLEARFADAQLTLP